MSRLSERSKAVRREIYKLSKANGGYHYGGTFSCVEILLAIFDYVLKPEDRFILSKGHACWALYALLRERGLFPSLEGHPHLDVANGVHWTTGSEGHGFPAGVGMAFARRQLGKPGRVYVVMGDGECQEGTTWESMLMAVQYKLDNLTVIVDWNELQACDLTHKILSIGSFPDVADAIGWHMGCVDGHDVDLLVEALGYNHPGRPRMIIASTVKGKGVSFMEGKAEWHAKYPNKEEEKALLEELA